MKQAKTNKHRKNKPTYKCLDCGISMTEKDWVKQDCICAECQEGFDEAHGQDEFNWED